MDFEQLLARTRSLLKQKELVDELEKAENVLVSLATALDAKDSLHEGHSEARGANYAEALGEAVGLSRGDRRNLHRAGLLHDIGKIGIPLEYLHKPGPLTTAEYAEGEAAPRDRLRDLPAARTMAPLLALIRGHHERLDGRGYPDGLRGDEIPLRLALPHHRRRLRCPHLRPCLPRRPGPGEGPRDHAPGGERGHVGRGLIDTFAEVVLKAGALR